MNYFEPIRRTDVDGALHHKSEGEIEQLRHRVQAHLKYLPKFEAMVLQRRIGIGAPSVSLDALAAEISTSREFVRQAALRALSLLRQSNAELTRELERILLPRSQRQTRSKR